MSPELHATLGLALAVCAGAALVEEMNTVAHEVRGWTVFALFVTTLVGIIQCVVFIWGTR